MLKRQIEEQEYQKKVMSDNKRQQDLGLLQKQLLNQTQIQQESLAVKAHQVQAYKTELERQQQMKQQMQGYGNMSAAEKALNKDDLFAYKQIDNKNYAMIPGIQQSKVMNEQRMSAGPGMTTTGLGSPKPKREGVDKLAENNERYKQHGAVHFGKEVANYEPKQYLGVGNLLNGGFNNRQPSPYEKAKRADTLYAGPAGSSLGGGRTLWDGTVDRQQSILIGGNQMTPQ